ncbi:MAG: hypothetical protein EBX52_14000, partial [Proteobacteria bacterium]|nr:hypothetical protein [Pseudomonadota bacterium]
MKNRCIRILLSFILVSGAESGMAYSANGKPLVGVKCVFRDESVLSCAAMTQFIQDSLDGVVVVQDPNVPIVISLSDQAIGDSVE